jgi:CRP/FNR family transcriptional regulator, cyclic AMP receptor protein
MQLDKFFSNSQAAEEFAADAVIFEQGQSGDKMYVIIEGEVRVEANGKELETLKTGDILGEMSLLDGSPRSATATAATACKLVPLTQHNLRFLLSQNMFFTEQMLTLMSERVRHMNKVAAS